MHIKEIILQSRKSMVWVTPVSYPQEEEEEEEELLKYMPQVLIYKKITVL